MFVKKIKVNLLIILVIKNIMFIFLKLLNFKIKNLTLREKLDKLLNIINL